jgi:aspartate racemase
MNNSKTIGIIGGQGPLSTADFYMRIIKYYQDNLGAKYIQDYPPMVIFSVPSPDLISGVANEELVFNLMADAAKKLERDGCAFIVIACNSVQFLLERLQALVKIPIISIAKITTAHVKSKGYKSVGILGTYTTVNKRIYDPYLEKENIRLIKPNSEDQKVVEQVILSENAGKVSDSDKARLITVMEALQKDGAEAILLACTELPLFIKQADTSIPLIDSNELYAIETARLSSTQDD